MRHCKSFYFEFRKFCVKLQFYNLFTVGVSRISRPSFPHLRNWHYSLSHRFLVGHTEIMATETQGPTSPRCRTHRRLVLPCPTLAQRLWQVPLIPGLVSYPMWFPRKSWKPWNATKIRNIPIFQKACFYSMSLAEWLSRHLFLICSWELYSL